MTDYTSPQTGFSVIQLRRASAEFWTAQNPVLRKGEMGYDLTNKQVKIGDGTTAWNSLYYSTVPDVNIDDPQDDQALVYDTGQWTNKTPIAAASVAKTKPSPATDGALWFDPEDARLYRYYDDGTGAAQWVEINQTIAQQSNTFTSVTLSTPLGIASGGTGVTLGSGLVPLLPTSVTVASGSASVSSTGVVTLSGASELRLDGIFSSQYSDYHINFVITSGVSVQMLMKLRKGGVTDAQSVYSTNGVQQIGSGTPSNWQAQSTTVWYLLSGAGDNSMSMDVYSPNIATVRTKFTGTASGYNTANTSYSVAAVHDYFVGADFDGFAIAASSGTMSGRLQVFGWKS